MSNQILPGKRVLITHADAFMGPVLRDVFASHGATVIPNTDSLMSADAPAAVVAGAGRVDILVVNLAMPAPNTAATEVSDDEWNDTFAALVHPLPRLFRAVLPAMVERRSGKILVMGSASALRGMKRSSTYSAARGAQLAYVQGVGVEGGPHNGQGNAVAQQDERESQQDDDTGDDLLEEVHAARQAGAPEQERHDEFGEEQNNQHAEPPLAHPARAGDCVFALWRGAIIAIRVVCLSHISLYLLRRIGKEKARGLPRAFAFVSLSPLS